MDPECKAMILQDIANNEWPEVLNITFNESDTRHWPKPFNANMVHPRPHFHISSACYAANGPGCSGLFGLHDLVHVCRAVFAALHHAAHAHPRGARRGFVNILRPLKLMSNERVQFCRVSTGALAGAERFVGWLQGGGSGTFYKLYGDRLFPHLDRVIWADIDVTWLTDIGPLWDNFDSFKNVWPTPMMVTFTPPPPG